MSAISISILRRDHINFSVLLNALERQIEAAESRRPFSMPLFKAAIRYFRDYPRRVHHPKEDLIYGALVRHHRHDTRNVFHVLEDHREMEANLTAMGAKLREIDVKDIGQIDSFCEAAKEFIKAERNHMELEEGHLYPMAVHLISPEEWMEIDTQFENENDATFEGAEVPPLSGPV